MLMQEKVAALQTITLSETTMKTKKIAIIERLGPGALPTNKMSSKAFNTLTRTTWRVAWKLTMRPYLPISSERFALLPAMSA